MITRRRIIIEAIVLAVIGVAILAGVNAQARPAAKPAVVVRPKPADSVHRIPKPPAIEKPKPVAAR
jgi:hypothetical protein